MAVTLDENELRDLNEAAEEQTGVVGEIVAMDDDPLTVHILKVQLKKAGYKLKTASDGAGGLELVSDSTAVALVDLRMPDLSGFDCLRHIREHHPHTQVIILTGSNEVHDAVEAMREGAFQFVTKPFDPKQLQVYIAKGIQAWRLANENRNLKESHSHNLPVRVADTTGDMHSRLMQQVHRIADLDATAFIGGESGTGKSTIARLIHQKSNRSKGPFVTVNCASLPRDLLQSELFGHTRGAFTGAIKDRPGHAEVADGGTLFLDEIGDLPLDLQPKLLTFLQDRVIQRLGSTESRKVDVRLIVATHRDLAEMCRENRFRQDLYFRLLVLHLELPALRHRLAELPGIAAGILHSICQRHNVEVHSIAGEALELLMAHEWPGNIRELENVLERAVAFCEGAELQSRDLLFSNVVLDRRQHLKTESNPYSSNGSAGQTTCMPPLANATGPSALPINSMPSQSAAIGNPGAADSGFHLAGNTLAAIEREAIIQTLNSCNGNKARSARMLGISEKSIYNKMRRLNITYKSEVGPE